MKDLSLHLLDILENSARAGARRVDVTWQWTDDVLRLRLEDDGPGFAPPVSMDPADPYATTRSDRPVGLGLALLKEAAEQTGGRLQFCKPDGRGVSLEASFNMAHIDAKPLGDIAGAMVTAIFGWPEMNIVLVAGDTTCPVLDMEAVRDSLEGVSIAEPEVQEFIRRELITGLAPLVAWADGVMGGAVAKR